MKRENQPGNTGLTSERLAAHSPGPPNSPHNVPVRSSIIISRLLILTDRRCAIQIVSPRVIAFGYLRFASSELAFLAAARILTNRRDSHYKSSLNHGRPRKWCFV